MKKESPDIRERFVILWRIVLSMLIFFAANVPFRLIMHILPYSEVRPSNVIPPVLGILFGMPGAVGTALANMLGDIFISKSSFDVYLPGAVINVLYGYLPYYLWNRKGTKKTGENTALPRMDSVSEILRYCVAVLITSAVITPLLTITFQLTGQSIGVEDFLFLFFNNFDFSILLGVPILIFVSFLRERKKGRRLAIGTRAVAGFMVLSAVFVTTLGILAYTLLKNYAPYDSLRRWQIVYQVVGIGINVLFGGTLLFLWYVENRITNPLLLLTESMKKFASADHLQQTQEDEMKRACEQIRTGDELQILAQVFFKMTQDIEMYVRNLKKVTVEKEKIRAELSVATNIQKDMLPNVFPPFPQKKEFQIYAFMHPAKEVGGDFYDFFLVDDNHLGIVIADVSGKGVPAALFMVVAKTLLQNQAKLKQAPWDVLYHINNQLCENNSTGMFVTAWFGVLELDSGQLLYSNAGHTKPMFSCQGGAFQIFTDIGHGFVLGGIKNMCFPEGRYTLKRKDRLFLYTDGVTEANDRNENLFGETRLQGVLDDYRAAALEGMLKGVKQSIDTFANGTEQFDDITMLAIQYEGVEKDETGNMAELC